MKHLPLLVFLATSTIASATVIVNPDAAYTSSTTLINIPGADLTTTNILTNGTVTINFDQTMTVATVPDTWATWNTPPNAETATPRILYNDTGLVFSFNLSVGVTTLGFEFENDGGGATTATAQFRHGTTVLESVVLGIDSGAGSRLFAVTEGTTIDNVIVTQLSPAGGGGFANFRYSGADAATPEPGTLALLPVGLAAFALVRRRMRTAA